jgi:hypothetical protein
MHSYAHVMPALKEEALCPSLNEFKFGSLFSMECTQRRRLCADVDNVQIMLALHLRTS